MEVNLILNAAKASVPNVLMDFEEKHPGYTHIALSIGDVKATQAALEAAGITITEGPVALAEGVTGIFVRDPDRNVIEFNHKAN